MCSITCCAAIRNNDTAAVPATDKAAAADGGRGRKAGKHPPGRSVVDTKLVRPVSGTSRCTVIRDPKKRVRNTCTDNVMRVVDVTGLGAAGRGQEAALPAAHRAPAAAAAAAAAPRPG